MQGPEGSEEGALLLRITGFAQKVKRMSPLRMCPIPTSLSVLEHLEDAQRDSCSLKLTWESRLNYSQEGTGGGGTANRSPLKLST